MKHKGVSLVEVIIVVGILGVFTALILGGVQKARNSAALLQSKNNLRQIILATHQYSDSIPASEAKLTGTKLPKKLIYRETSIFWEILPWLDVNHTMPAETADSGMWQDYLDTNIAVFISPADPSTNFNHVTTSYRARSSYACNFLTFDRVVLFPLAIPDGLSSTISYSEHYFYCGSTGGSLKFNYIFDAQVPDDLSGFRRASFADSGWHDVVPVTDPNTRQTVGSVRGSTFQYRPTVMEADSRLAQTPHPGGLPVALFDGSVRTLSPSISETVYWALVTPSGGEVVGDF
jgi:prepilin-type N-terminal cleavage/methylation domain-containing protein/prepilin-type processing-associated H-X9-DG protein